MEDLKRVIAENLVDLRKANKLTQLELAEKLKESMQEKRKKIKKEEKEN